MIQVTMVSGVIVLIQCNSARDSDEDEVVVKPKLKLKPRKTKKPKLKLKPRKVKSVCGINPKTGRCKRGENTNIDKCMVNKNGNCAKKI